MGAHALEKVVRSRDDREVSILQMYQLSLRAQSMQGNSEKHVQSRKSNGKPGLGAWAAEGWRRYQLEQWIKWERKRTIDSLSRMHRPLCKLERSARVVDQALRTAEKRAFWKLDGRAERWDVKILAGQPPDIE